MNPYAVDLSPRNPFQSGELREQVDKGYRYITVNLIYAYLSRYMTSEATRPAKIVKNVR